MSKKNDSQAKTTMTYVIILGLLVIACMYFFVYKKLDDKTIVLKADNDVKQTEVDELKVYYDNMESYKNDIATMGVDIDNWVNEFPADLREEDMLKVALDSLEDAEIEYKGIMVSTATPLKVVEAETITNAKLEGYESPLEFMQQVSAYTTVNRYEDMKELIDTINKQPKRNSIKNIVYTKNNETQKIEGTTEVSFYYVLGTNRTYEPVKFPEYKKGTEDLFALKTEEEMEEEEKQKEEAEKKAN